MLPTRFLGSGVIWAVLHFLQFKLRIKHNRKHPLYIHQATRLFVVLPSTYPTTEGERLTTLVTFIHAAVVIAVNICNINTGHHCHSVFAVWHKIQCELMIA